MAHQIEFFSFSLCSIRELNGTRLMVHAGSCRQVFVAFHCFLLFFVSCQKIPEFGGRFRFSAFFAVLARRACRQAPFPLCVCVKGISKIASSNWRAVVFGVQSSVAEAKPFHKTFPRNAPLNFSRPPISTKAASLASSTLKIFSQKDSSETYTGLPGRILHETSHHIPRGMPRIFAPRAHKNKIGTPPHPKKKPKTPPPPKTKNSIGTWRFFPYRKRPQKSQVPRKSAQP